MDVLSVASGDRQMWVRGPTAQQAPAASAVPDTSTLWSGSAASSGQAGRQIHQVAWVNAHGGAGASTLARELGGADMGRRWPDPAREEPGRMLLVARTHAAGMQAASQALDTLRMEDHPAGVRLVALVLVADAPGRLPIALGRRVRVLRSVVQVHRLPWIPAWRLGKPTVNPPRELRRLMELVAEGTR
ncbi:DUF6668 family protein [Streptomyces sp. NPDC007901]|uniref:DUF6668 family protein n=1 Tax=Streptomyces sp. NPDC007901 TaxID=3364785 RepID=UPI0036E944DA